MQVTLEIDDDVLEAGQKLSELARNGLCVEKRPLSVFGSGEIRNGVPMLPRRDDVISLEHVQELIESKGV